MFHKLRLVLFLLLCFTIIQFGLSQDDEFEPIVKCPFRRGAGGRMGVKIATISVPEEYRIEIVTERNNENCEECDWFKILENNVEQATGSSFCKDKFLQQERPLKLPRHGSIELMWSNSYIEHRTKPTVGSSYGPWVVNPDAKWNCYTGILTWIHSFCG